MEKLLSSNIRILLIVDSNWFWTKLNKRSRGKISSCKQFCRPVYFIYIYTSLVALFTTSTCRFIVQKSHLTLQLVQSNPQQLSSSHPPATQSVVFIPLYSGLHHHEISMTNFLKNIQRTRPCLWYWILSVINCMNANGDDLNITTSYINQWGKSRYLCRSPCRMETTAVIFIRIPGMTDAASPRGQMLGGNIAMSMVKIWGSFWVWARPMRGCVTM